jgi:hypothetical protein
LPLTVVSVVPDSAPMIQFRNKTYPVSYERRHQS